MTEEQMISFAKRIRSQRKSKGDTSGRRKFEDEMRDIAVFSIDRNIPLDPAIDAPLPEWARRILCEKCLSKRLVIELLKHHDGLIRKHRLSVARLATPAQEDFQNNNQEQEGEEHDDDD